MKKLLGIATLALMLAGTSLAQNLVTNGGFELGNGGLGVGGGGFDGWTPLGETAAHFDSTNAFTFLDDGSYSSVVSGPHSGSYMADFGSWDQSSGISQSIGTTAGHTYQVSFWLANDDGCSNRGCFTSINVSFGGVTLINDTYQDRFGFTFYQFDVVAGGSSSDLSFNIEQDPAYYYLDDVSVVDETPEPASLALLGSALSLGAGFIRRFRS